MLETERLILRPLDENDIEAVYEMRSDADVMRFIREPQSLDETENWIRLVSSLWEKDKLGFCAVIEKETLRFSGWCGIWHLKESGELEVGYAIAKDFWNKGFATEAAEKFIEYAFETLNPEKVVAVAEPENLASRRVMEKLGMKLVKIGEFYNRQLIQYAISKEDFLTKKLATNKHERTQKLF
jgi:ribosomal-protein-alanine N-acetyltransferase